MAKRCSVKPGYDVQDYGALNKALHVRLRDRDLIVAHSVSPRRKARCIPFQKLPGMCARAHRSGAPLTGRAKNPP